MVSKIKDVVVDKISLVSDEEIPAVPKAETKFAFFKSFGFSFWSKKMSGEQIESLKKIQNTYESIEKKGIEKGLSSLTKKYTF